ncbi:MAG: M55 family metallopeptidase [Myxococcaceae bacterium]|jgi:D-amino peptidase|nr:M55 family metallopeptidase [Myxococcaceae bacterium]MCA3014209.1 M55 family metallopeptidase [Myxococcaceae bacterium]
MPRALIVIDLEGVHGADRVEALIGGAAAWERARLRATHELNLAIAGLSRQGFTEFVVSDSHRNGTEEPNLVLDAVDPRARYELRDDAFAPALFWKADAVAALGMHAGGGMPGYVSHALDVGLAWELGGRCLSETDFLLDLCAQAAVPFLFVSGDEALTRSLPPRVRGVTTKRVISAVRASSLPLEAVEQALVEAALRPAAPATPLPQGPLRLHVKSKAFDVPELPFLTREAAHVVRVEGSTPRERYANALVAVDCVASATEAFVESEPGDDGFVEAVERLLAAPWPSLSA